MQISRIFQLKMTYINISKYRKQNYLLFDVLYVGLQAQIWRQRERTFAMTDFGFVGHTTPYGNLSSHLIFCLLEEIFREMGKKSY